MDCIFLIAIEQIQGAIATARYIAPDSLRQIMPGKEHHAVDWASLVVSNKWHFLARLQLILPGRWIYAGN
jgi:hypothetical protein